MALNTAQKEQLLQRATIVRQETMEKANTAQRIGSLFYDIIRFLGSMDEDELSQLFLRKDRDDETTKKLTMGEAVVKGDATIEGKTTGKDYATFEKRVTVKDDATFEKGVTAGAVHSDSITPNVSDTTTLTGKLNVTQTASANRVESYTAGIKNGLTVGDYMTGDFGSGGTMQMNGGDSYIEIDKLKVRKKAEFSELDIKSLKYVGGAVVISPASMTIDAVEEKGAGESLQYVCYFKKQDGSNEIKNEWEADDQARCQFFNQETNTLHYYWRLVVARDRDFSLNYKKEDYHSVTLSGTDCDSGSDKPMKGDEVVHLGNRTDTDRQSAIILSAYDINSNAAPSIVQYAGINDYSLVGKELNKIAKDGNKFVGEVTMTAGNIGNIPISDFTALPADVQAALTASEEAKEGVNDVLDMVEKTEYGQDNLILNSGFTGDYRSIYVVSNSPLVESTQMYSPSLEHWTVNNATVQQSSVARSLCEVNISGGSIQQTLHEVAKAGEYVFAFVGKGSNIGFRMGDVNKVFTLSSSYERQYVKFKTTVDATSINIYGTGVICDVLLEKGNIAPSSWEASILDRPKELEEVNSLQYLADAIKNGSTTVLGGLILSNIIQLGNYVNHQMKSVTAGVSGSYVNNDSVAFWTGGTLEKAINAVKMYASDPTRELSTSELASIAKVVFTHGGRGILNDIILRGYIYALGGKIGNWRIENGAISHSSGLTLTSDGKLIAPSLSMKVGGNALSASKAYNILPFANFASGRGHLQDGNMSFVSDINYNGKVATSLFGTYIAVISEARMTVVLKSFDVKPNAQYRLSIWTYNPSDTLNMFLSENGETKKTYTISASNVLWKQNTYTFTTSNVTKMAIGFSSSDKMVSTIAICGMCMTEGTSDEGWVDYDPIPTAITNDLRATGIDISQHLIRLTANMFECFNNSGDKTAWLDELGNFVTTGIQQSLMQNINNAAKFAQLFIPCYTSVYGDWVELQSYEDGMLPSGSVTIGGVTMKSVQPIISERLKGDEIASGNRRGNYCFSLDMRSASGLIDIAYKVGTTSQFMTIILPWMRMSKDNISGVTPAVRDMDVLRTPTRMNGDMHYITLSEVRSLIGGKMTIKNSTNKVMFVVCGVNTEFVVLEPMYSKTFEFVFDVGDIVDVTAMAYTPYYHWKPIESTCIDINDSEYRLRNFGTGVNIE